MESYAANVLAQVQLAGSAEPAVAYGLIALGTALLGNLVAFPAMLLGFDDVFGPGSVFLAPLAALAGQLLGDATWYALGRKTADTRLGSWLRDRLPANERVTRFFEGGSVYILITSKLFAAPTVPILFLLGWNQTPPARYARLSLISAGAWFAAMVAFSVAIYSGIRIVF